jgi:hypothetical protein
MAHTKHNCEIFGCNTKISFNCQVQWTYCIKVCVWCTACIKMVIRGVTEAMMHYSLGYTLGYSLSNSPHYKNILHKQVKIQTITLKWASEKTSKDCWHNVEKLYTSTWTVKHWNILTIYGCVQKHNTYITN